jgi:4-hydroxythreonine-4-phosphate dehydrogenase
VTPPSPESPTRIAITVGDPAGIGPEVIASALRARAQGDAIVRLYGDVGAVVRAGGPVDGLELRTLSSATVEPGRPDAAASKGVVEAIRRAARDCLQGELDAMVTAPISKATIAEGGFDYPGHTELLAEAAGAPEAVMMLVGGRLRVALATIHCPLREVPGRLTTARIAGTLEILNADLERLFAIERPRIAVCGLNPHAGEGGRFGDEEARVIRPAIERAREREIDASGPHAADSLFHRAATGEFDAVLGMYHDQALGPLKVHAFGRAVNVTLGLPLVRTSVDHGTAFDIAGQGRANGGSMEEAIRLAIALAENRRRSERR